MDQRDARPHNPFAAMLLLAVALVGWLGLQAWILTSERAQLEQLATAQTRQMEAAGKLRASLDAVAVATLQLAEGGNVNARVLVEQLRQRGVTIKPTSGPQPPQ